MRVAVIGSGTVDADISQFIPAGLSELIICGEQTKKIELWAHKRRIPKLTLSADNPIKLSHKKLAKTIAEIADIVIVIGSTLTALAKLSIDCAKKAGKPVRVYVARQIIT